MRCCAVGWQVGGYIKGKSNHNGLHPTPSSPPVLDMLCYSMLCYAMLCYATLRWATLCCATMVCYRYAMVLCCYATLCYAKLFSISNLTNSNTRDARNDILIYVHTAEYQSCVCHICLGILRVQQAFKVRNSARINHSGTRVRC